MSEIRLTVPLPPVSLRANSRSHWRRKNTNADDYSRAVYLCAYDALQPVYRDQNPPWDAADVHYEWHYASAEPDLGNIPGNVKVLQDILCMAPPTKAGANRFYLGLVDNDRHISPTYSMVKEARRAAERVVVTLQPRMKGIA